MNELLQWKAAAEGMPDCDTTVLMWVKYPSDGASIECDWAAGWWDGEHWRDANSAMVVAGQVTHWAEPNGPADGNCASIAGDDLDVLAAYSRTDGRREWVNVGVWLRPGEVVAHMDDPRLKKGEQP